MTGGTTFLAMKTLTEKVLVKPYDTHRLFATKEGAKAKTHYYIISKWLQMGNSARSIILERMDVPNLGLRHCTAGYQAPGT